jgi:flavin-dependent dehydrogenase
MRADVVVVGAGPAGSVCALLFARAGFHVMIVDRQSFPRPKPCGDCLSPQVARLLHDLGLLERVMACSPARLAGWRIIGPNCACFEARFDSVARGDPLVSRALSLPRAQFDRVLLEAAQAAGAQVETGVHITELLEPCGVVGTRADRSVFRVKARLVIGADGLRSVVARRMQVVRRAARLRKVSLTAHVWGAELDPYFGEMHLGHGLTAGVAPVTACRDALFNVTLVANAQRFGRDLARHPDGFFRTAVEAFPLLRGKFQNAEFQIDDAARPARGYGLMASGPFDVPTRNVVADGFALVGDAAGYYDPFTGQGIFQAIAGARLLADAAVPWLRRPVQIVPGLRDYARRRRALVWGPKVLQHLIEEVTSRANLADEAIARLFRRPTVGRRLLAATGDLASAWTVFSPANLLAFAAPLALARQ